MKVLILGGTSPWHYDWVREVGYALRASGYDVITHDYQHWSKGETQTDIEHEITTVGNIVKDFDDYIVVAKSIGTIITALGTARGILKPTRCIMLGVPYRGFVEYIPTFWDDLACLPRTVFIQNENDPFMTADELKQRLDTTNLKERSLISTPGDTHDYRDFALIAKQLSA